MEARTVLDCQMTQSDLAALQIREATQPKLAKAICYLQILQSHIYWTFSVKNTAVI